MSRRQSQVLDRLVSDKALSPQGRNFLIGALDPFHDTEIEVDGFPDITSARSVVQVLQYTKTITKPVGLAAGNWDLHLSNMPLSSDLSTAVPSLLAVIVNSLGEISVNAGIPAVNSGFLAQAVPSGASMDAISGIRVGDGLGLPKSYSAGTHRIFGLGFEVINATAPLYRQGSVTTYRKPSHRVGGFGREPISPFKCSTYDYISGPVLTVAQAANFPNSRTWGAEEGVYGIATLNDINCPVVRATPNGGFASTIDAVGTGSAYGYGNLPADASLVHSYPFDITGAIFTGLSDQTSLTVTVRYLIERFPGPAETDLVVLGRPSPAFDPLALELYSRCLEHLPACVRVSENPFGEWFNKVLGAVAEYAPAVARIFPHPLVSGIVSTVGHAARALHRPEASTSTAVEAPRRQRREREIEPSTSTDLVRTRRPRAKSAAPISSRYSRLAASSLARARAKARPRRL